MIISFLIQRANQALCLISFSLFSQNTLLSHPLLFYFLLPLCILFSGCSSPTRQWQIEKIITQSSCYNGARLLLSPTDECEYLELEIVRYRSGIRFYINLFHLQARPLEEDNNYTKAEITFADSDTVIPIFPYILAGGQRLLLEGKDAEWIIEALKNNQTLYLTVGRHCLEIVPIKFGENYDQFLTTNIS